MITIAIVSLLMAGCAGSKRPDVQTLGDGYELPEPGVGQGGPAYQTEQEDDDVAKADALAVIEGYEPLYGLTEPPPAGVELLPEWVVSDAVLVSWYDPFSDYFDELIQALSPHSPVWVLTADEGESASLKVRWQDGRPSDNIVFERYTRGFLDRD